MIVRINTTPNKNNNSAIDMQNWLVYVFTTRWVGLGLWSRCASYVRKKPAHYIHAKTAYQMHTTHMHIIEYERQSPFLGIDTMSFHFYLAYYLYTFSWDRAQINL